MLTITITGTNDQPVAVADTNAGDPVVESGVNPGNTPFAGCRSANTNCLTNDPDYDAGDTHTLTAINAMPGNIYTLAPHTSRPIHLNSDGSYTYTLDNSLAATQALAQDQVTTDV